MKAFQQKKLSLRYALKNHRHDDVDAAQYNLLPVSSLIEVGSKSYLVVRHTKNICCSALLTILPSANKTSLTGVSAIQFLSLSLPHDHHHNHHSRSFAAASHLPPNVFLHIFFCTATKNHTKFDKCLKSSCTAYLANIASHKPYTTSGGLAGTHTPVGTEWEHHHLIRM